MKIQEQYEELLKLKSQINEKLQNLDFPKMKDLLLWLAKSQNYQKLKTKDNQLIMLEFFCDTWLEEKKQLPYIGIVDDIFWGVNSLDDVEKKYLTIQFGVLRLETTMPEEYYKQAVDRIVNYKVSGIALSRIIIKETKRREENIVKVARLLKKCNQLISATLLLEEAEKIYSQNPGIIIELADCWMEAKQWSLAREYLNKIENPDEEMKELKKELEKKMLHEEI